MYRLSEVRSAARYGRVHTLRRLHIEGFDMDAKGWHGTTPLFLACRGGHTTSVEFLLQSGACVKSVAEDGFTPLHHACWAGACGYESGSLLLAYGADPNACDNHRHTSLMYAAGSGEVKWIEMLLHSGASLDTSNTSGETALSYALTWKQLAASRVLLNLGASVNPEDGIQSALLCAAGTRRTEFVNLVVEFGALCSEHGRLAKALEGLGMLKAYQFALAQVPG